MSAKVNGRTHLYNSTAHVLSGSLQLPLIQEIKHQAHAQLPEEGGYFSQRLENYRLEGVISVGSAYTHVAGNLSTKPGQGWTTVTTTVVENLNVMEILTADRIVGQMITEHPLVGYVPSINFLGSRFENLRIAGFSFPVEFDLGILGSKPANDGSYSQDPGVVARVRSQYTRILESDGLPEDLRERYNRLLSSLGSPEAVECSLVNRATGGYPGSSYGHIIDIPDFGKIVLGKVIVSQEDYMPGTATPKKTTIQLTMVDLQLGCAAAGNAPIGSGSTNGGTIP